MGQRPEHILLRQRQHSNLVRGQPRVEFQNSAHIVVDLFFDIGRQQERHHRPSCARGWLNDVGHITLARGLIEVFELFVGCRGVSLKVVVASIGDSLKLAPTPREHELDITGASAVVA